MSNPVISSDFLLSTLNTYLKGFIASNIEHSTDTSKYEVLKIALDLPSLTYYAVCEVDEEVFTVEQNGDFVDPEWVHIDSGDSLPDGTQIVWLKKALESFLE